MIVFPISLFARKARVCANICIAGMAAFATAAFANDAAVDASADRARHKAVDAIFAEWGNAKSPGCAVGVVKDGVLDYANGYGMANLEHMAPITPDTVFYIASTSKQFAAMAALLAARAGHFSLDDDIRRHFPAIPDYGETITIRALIQHTSGMRDFLALWGLSGRSWSNYIPPAQAFDLISRQRSLMFKPGERWSYSNSGYFLLSQLIERTTGKSLREYTDENIFRPLGMRDTHFHDDHNMIVPNRAIGHERKEDGDYEMVWSAFDLVGSGGLHTTVRDMVKWNANFDDNRLEGGSKNLMRAFLERGVQRKPDDASTTYGLGLMHSVYRGLAVVGHTGSSFGYRADYLRIPEEDFAAMALCNAEESDPKASLRRVVDAYLFDGVAADEAPAAKPAEEKDEAGADADERDLYQASVGDLRRMVGDYYSDELDAKFRLRLNGDSLELRREYAPAEELLNVRRNVFALSADTGAPTLTFTAGADSAGDRLTVKAGRIGEINFVRLQ